MNIIYKKTEELKPYPNNPRKNNNAINYVANSIKEFGFKVPIVIDSDNVIVCGHTRLKAAQKLGMDNVPCIVADDLTEQQLKAFRLADNKVSEFAIWDSKKLEVELEDLRKYEMDISELDFGFKEADDGDRLDIDDGYFGDAREATLKAYNLEYLERIKLTDDKWQMPIIENNHFIPEKLMGFNYAKTSQSKNTGIHFYIDDYQFERLWNKPIDYAMILSEYECCLSPDFSLYLDMPYPMMAWNVYRSRFIGALYQSYGLRVIPTMSWGPKETFDFCFKGIPENSIVSVSTIGIKENDESFEVWTEGMREMIKQIKPEHILVYGGKVDFDYGDTNVKYYENYVTERMKNSYNKGKKEKELSQN